MRHLMKDLIFDKKTFLKTILIFIILMAIWTALSIKTDDFTKHDKGFVTGLGYLMVFSISFHFGQKKKPVKSFFYLMLSILALYCFSTFILGTLFFGLANSYFIYCVINSILVSFVMTHKLDKFYIIELKKETFIITSICILFSYWANEIYNEYLNPDVDKNPGRTIFVFFQSFAFIPLLLGLTLKKVRV